MTHLLAILITAALGAMASCAGANSLAEVAVINRSTGERLPVYRHDGHLYVEGKAGDRYAVELRNRSAGRILTVLSVDGVNAVTGQTAAASQSGYVIGSWDAAEISGWRKNMDDVAAFYFTAVPNSYAARTGRPDNVGVIGVAVYAEYFDPPRAMLQAPAMAKGEASGSSAARDAAAPASPSETSALREKQREEKLGTGHGERLYEPTQSTEFRRATRAPGEVITIFYGSRQNLVAQGVIPRSQRLPQAFPNSGFVPDPT